MFYFITTENEFIVSYGTSAKPVYDVVTKEEYENIVETVKNKAAAPEGYAYMLRADTLEWELVELPPEPEPGDEEAGEEDFIEVLDDLGVRLG